MGKSMAKLNVVLSDFLDNFGLVDFFAVNIKDEDSINEIMYQADTILQYHESQEPKEEYYKDIDTSYKEEDFDGDYAWK